MSGFIEAVYQAEASLHSLREAIEGEVCAREDDWTDEEQGQAESFLEAVSQMIESVEELETWIEE